MLYVQQTYNMRKSLWLSGFAPCHVIWLYVFAKFIKNQLPTEGHSVTD